MSSLRHGGSFRHPIIHPRGCLGGDGFNIVHWGGKGSVQLLLLLLLGFSFLELGLGTAILEPDLHPSGGHVQLLGQVAPDTCVWLGIFQKGLFKHFELGTGGAASVFDFKGIVERRPEIRGRCLGVKVVGWVIVMGLGGGGGAGGYGIRHLVRVDVIRRMAQFGVSRHNEWRDERGREKKKSMC